MSSEVETRGWRAVGPASWGALPAYLRESARPGATLPTAGGFVPPSALEEREGGPAWSDEAFQSELRDAHARMEADASSMTALDDLAAGAPCVITGQQPGLLGGPLYTAWKIAGTLALAEDLRARWGRPVVPVFWCAADDSDFDEVGRAWWATPGRAARRLQLPRSLHGEGQMVGSLEVAPVAELEAAAFDAPVDAPQVRDWGEHFGAQLLRRFRGRGLVVVDARSSRLRERGQPLFRDYAGQAREVARELEEHQDGLRESGWPAALDARARSSGLFSVLGSRRARWEPGADGRLEGTEWSPSVILRPLWQDQQLAPAAVLLGPGEIGYHAELTPLYDRFGVRAPATLPRPHGVLLPPGPPADAMASRLEELVASPDSARRALVELGADPEVDASLARAREASLRVLDELREGLGGRREEVVRRLRWRQEREWERARRALHARGAHDWREQLGWLWPQDRAQERTLAQAVLDHSFRTGEDFWGPFEDGYLAALEERTWFTAALFCGDHDD